MSHKAPKQISINLMQFADEGIKCNDFVLLSDQKIHFV